MTEKPDLEITRISQFALIGALIFTLLLFILAASGVSDPKPLGEKITGEGEILLSGENGTAFYPASSSINPPGTARATLSFAKGTGRSAYGLAWGPDGDRHAVLVTPEGYLGILTLQGEDETMLQPFERYPHVKPSVNTFQLDFTDGEVVIWLNEEHVVTLPWEGQERIEIAVLLRADEEASEVKIDSVELWGTSP